MLLDVPERGLGVELLGEDHRAAERVDRPTPAQRRCVIDRGGGVVDVGVGEAEEELRHRHQRLTGFVDATFREIRLDSLGEARGSGRVQHDGAARLLVEPWTGRGEGVLVRLETAHGAAERESRGTDRDLLADLLGEIAQCGRHDQALAPLSSTMYATSPAVRWLLTAVMYKPDRIAAQNTSKASG